MSQGDAAPPMGGKTEETIRGILFKVPKQFTHMSLEVVYNVTKIKDEAIRFFFLKPQHTVVHF